MRFQARCAGNAPDSDSLHNIMSSIPVIDLSSGDKEALCQAWDAAFRSFGCCILTGHGLAEEDFAGVKEEVSTFFSQSIEDKLLFNFGPYGNERGGYTPRAGESVSQSSARGESTRSEASGVTSDPVESFVMNPQTHQQYANTLPLSSAYYKKCEELVHRLHVLSTKALGIPEDDYFRKYYCASSKGAVGSEDPSFALRLAHYPPQEEEGLEEAGEASGRSCRYGAHTDYMGFTVLRPDESDWSSGLAGAGGLEVRVSSFSSGCDSGSGSDSGERWVPVVLPESIRSTALIINAGDLLQRWTSGRWASPLHRVLAPLPNSPAARRGRTALVFFSGPAGDALIPCLEGEGGLAPVLAADFLRSRIAPTALSPSHTQEAGAH